MIGRIVRSIDRRLEKYEVPIWVTSGFVAALSCFIILSVLFVKLADELREGDTLEFDRQVLLWINQNSVAFLDGAMPILTNLGGFIGVAAATAVLVGLAVLKRNYRLVLLLVIGVVGAVIVNVVLKLIFARERPDLWAQLVNENGYSFPSGHAMASAALAFSLLIALWRHRRYRVSMVILATLYIGFVGFSRMYLGVHYPSDIVAGWLVSGAWVAIVAWLVTVLPFGRLVRKFHAVRRRQE